MDARELDRRLLARRTRAHAALGRPFVRTVATGKGQNGLRERLEPFFAQHDVLLTPALARPLPQGRALARAGLAAQHPGQLGVLALHTAMEPDRLARDDGAGRHPALGRPLRRTAGGAPGVGGGPAGAGGADRGAAPLAADGTSGLNGALQRPVHDVQADPPVPLGGRRRPAPCPGS